MNEPVIIIGAPRSGTNMLRDILTELPGLETWPCDEINYIWRHGNRAFPSDEFTQDMATQKIQEYLRQEFARFAKTSNATTIVEKTCANSLRVGFVDKAFPEAKYVFIVRDGVDVIASAFDRWKAKLDIPYLYKKAKYVPKSDLAYYATMYLRTRIYKLFSNEKRLSVWGPKLDGMPELMSQYSLEQICAIQWQRCVENAHRDFENIDQERVIRLRYEDFVTKPAENLLAIAKFIGSPLDKASAVQMTNRVSGTSVGKGRAQLGTGQIAEICSPIAQTLEKYGY